MVLREAAAQKPYGLKIESFHFTPNSIYDFFIFWLQVFLLIFTHREYTKYIKSEAWVSKSITSINIISPPPHSNRASPCNNIVVPFNNLVLIGLVYNMHYLHIKITYRE